MPDGGGHKAQYYLHILSSALILRTPELGVLLGLYSLFKETFMKKTPLIIAAVASSFAALTPVAVLASTDDTTTSAQPQVEVKDSSIKSSIQAKFATETYNG